MARYVLHTTTLVIFIVLQVGWFPESYVQLIDQQLPETPPPASLQQLTETTDSEKQLLNRGQSPEVVIATNGYPGHRSLCSIKMVTGGPER